MKRIILRVDFNWPYEYRIEKTLPTIRALLKNGAASVVLITHCEKDGKIPHLNGLYKYLKKFFKNILFVEGPIKKMPEDFFNRHKNRDQRTIGIAIFKIGGCGIYRGRHRQCFFG